MPQRVGGIIAVQVNGEVHNAKGNWTYDLGAHKREAVVGADRVHGFKETPKPPFIEGEITDRTTLDLRTLVEITGATVTVQLANGKVIALRNAWFAGDGVGNSDEGNIAVRFEGETAEEIR